VGGAPADLRRISRGIAIVERLQGDGGSQNNALRGAARCLHFG
jgi:hypothetical protein